MGDPRRASKRRRRHSKPLPHLLSFSPFARHLSKSRVSSPLSGSQAGSDIPNPKIKPAEPSSSSEPESESDEGEDDDSPMEMVQADFGFFDPKPSDFGGVKLLLQNYLDDRVWDLSGFVDLILEQSTVGTVIKLDGYDEADDDNNDDGDGKKDDDGDEGVYAVISALNLGRYTGHGCFGELRKYLLESCKDENTKRQLKLLLEEEASDVGLLVSQRFVNCPLQLVPPLYDALFDEISWATEDEPTQEFRDSFKYKFYLLVTRIYESKNYSQHKMRVNGDCDEPIIYVKAEDEIFREHSYLSFTFPLHAEQLAPREPCDGKPSRTVRRALKTNERFTTTSLQGELAEKENRYHGFMLKNFRAMGLVMAVKAEEVPKFRTRLKDLLADS